MHRIGFALFIGSLLGLATGVGAQPLDQEVERLLNNDCSALGLQGGTDTGSAIGPNLDEVCRFNSPTAVSSAGGGAAAPQATDSSLESQRALERVSEEREGDPASNVLDLRGLFQIEGLGVWSSVDFARQDREVDRFEDGYESDAWSAVGGIDYRFADFLFAGVAFDYGRADADFDGGGGFETDGYGGALYGSLTPTPELFVDVAVGYAMREYEVDRAVEFVELEFGDPFATLSGIASSDTDADEFSASAVAGYEHAMGELSLTPRGGVSFVHTEIDGYRETGGTGLELVFSERTRQSLQSELGVTASMTGSAPFGVVIPQIDFEWIHEFHDDQRHTGVSFAEDLRAAPLVFTFENAKPDRDFFRLRAGVSVVLPCGLQFFAQYRTLLGHSRFDTQGVTAGLRLELGGAERS